MLTDYINAFAIIGIACAGFFTFAYIMRRFWRFHKFTKHTTDQGEIVILLDGENVIDTTPQADSFLAQTRCETITRDALIETLEPSFGSIGSYFDPTLDTPRTIVAKDGSGGWLNFSAIHGRVRLAIGASSKATQALAQNVYRSKENVELAQLRETIKHAPTLMWHSDDNGRLLWANDQYFATADTFEQTDTETLRLAEKCLFHGQTSTLAKGSTSERCSLKSDSDDFANWFDVVTFHGASKNYHYATNADPLVRAEVAQQKFVQTLSQTFAQLSTGLAIFDRRRQLSTFNPALLDMTGMNFEFLSSRPSLDAVFDRLRESRMLPEPKNYNTWRESFRALEADAKDGTYSEHWTLPDGRTFRVSGRPHPDGAFALLFEDISAGVSLTRHFRSEIETCQAVLDTIEDAVVVFSSGGNLVLSNRAYEDIWGSKTSDSLDHHDLRAELRKWQDRCTPTRIWTNLRELSIQIGLRKTWTDTAILDDGRHITCQADPISGGMTLIRFKFDKPMKPTLQKLTQVDHALIRAKP